MTTMRPLEISKRVLAVVLPHIASTFFSDLLRGISDTIAEEGKFREELDTVADKYREITGQELNPFYRPPQGKYNLDNLAMAQKQGYKTIFWSLAYVDWNVDAQPSREEAMAKLTGRVHPGAVVLLHNTSKTNGEILDELLTKWEEMGYRFGTLEELTS